MFEFRGKLEEFLVGKMKKDFMEEVVYDLGFERWVEIGYVGSREGYYKGICVRNRKIYRDYE